MSPWQERLSSLLRTILSSHLIGIEHPDIPTYYYFGEQHCDALVLLGYLSTVSNQSQSELAEFSDFLNLSIIVSHKTGGELFGSLSLGNNNSEELCGLSLYLPETRQDTSRYSSLALNHVQVETCSFPTEKLQFWTWTRFISRSKFSRLIQSNHTQLIGSSDLAPSRF